MGFQFASQPQHLYIDAAIENVLVHPRGLEEPLAGEWPLRSLQKRDEQSIFAFRQCHGSFVRAYQAAMVSFELPAAKFVSAPLWLARSRETAQFVPPQNGPHTCQQFSEAERLRHIVVRTEFEADHAINFLEPMPGSDNHGNIGVGSNLSQQIQSVFPPQSQVENDEARVAFGQMAGQFLPACRRTGRHRMLLEVTGDHPPGGGVIIDNKYVVSFTIVIGLQRAIHQ